MKTLTGGIVTVLFLTGSLMAQVAQVVVPKETPIKLKLVEPLRSENSHAGDSVAFKVADDVRIDGITVIPQGALAYGRIEKGSQWARRLGRGGWVFLELKNVTDVTGREIPVFEPRGGMGSDRGDHDARYMQARGRGTEIVLGMPNPYWLLTLGKSIEFPAGQIFVVVTRDEKTVDLTKLTENCGPQRCGTPLTPTKTDKTDVPLTPKPQEQEVHYYTLNPDGVLVASR